MKQTKNVKSLNSVEEDSEEEMFPVKKKKKKKNPNIPHPMAQQPLAGQGLLIIKASWSFRHTKLNRTTLDG